MKVKNYTEELKIPDGLEVKVEGSVLNVKGEKGELSRDFRNPSVLIEVSEGKVIFKVKVYTRKEKMILGTFKSHIKNMFYGASNGYNCKLKICSGHFPMNVTVNNNQLVIKNYIGEKVPRVLNLNSNVKVTVNGEEIIVEGIDIELVGQTAGSIEKLASRTRFDRRVFQQGIFITQKAKRSEI